MLTHELHNVQSLLKQAQALVANALGIVANAGEADLVRRIKEIGNLLIDVLKETEKPPSKGNP